MADGQAATFAERINAVTAKAQSAADAPILSKPKIIESAISDLLTVMHDMATALDAMTAGRVASEDG